MFVFWPDFHCMSLYLFDRFCHPANFLKFCGSWNRLCVNFLFPLFVSCYFRVVVNRLKSTTQCSLAGWTPWFSREPVIFQEYSNLSILRRMYYFGSKSANNQQIFKFIHLRVNCWQLVLFALIDQKQFTLTDACQQANRHFWTSTVSNYFRHHYLKHLE